MTENEFIQACLKKMEEYRQKYTPKERFAHMVARGIINEKGEVLVDEEERRAGHPIENVSKNGSEAK